MSKAFFIVALLAFAGCVEPKQKPDVHPTDSVAAPRVTEPCVITGCNSEICSDKGSTSFSTCVVLPQHACLQHSKCEPQKDGHCGWTDSPATRNCLLKLLK